MKWLPHRARSQWASDFYTVEMEFGRYFLRFLR